MNSADTIQVFDRPLVRERRTRAAADIEDYRFLFDEVADRLHERLCEIRRPFSDRLDLGALNHPADPATQPLSGHDGLHVTADITAAMPGAKLVLEEEMLPFRPGSFDLVVSNLMLHWVNDLPGALIQIQRTLRPDGLFLASMFGGDTLFELRSSLMQAEEEISGGISPRISPFADVRDLGGLLQRAGFALPVSDSDTITVQYRDPFRLLADLRGMGQTSALIERNRRPLGRAIFMRAAEIYQQRFGQADGRVPATFQILYLTGWHPHDSQQKPLKPGSARTSLASALGSEEIKLKG